MNMDIVQRTEDSMEFMVEGIDISVLQVIQHELMKDDSVEFAAYRRSHPLERKYFFIVKTKEGSPEEALLRAIDAASKVADVMGREIFDVLLGEVKEG